MVIIFIISFFNLKNHKAYCEKYGSCSISPYATMTCIYLAFYLFILVILYIFEKFKIFYSVYYFFCITGIYLLCDIGVFYKIKIYK